MRRQCQTIRIAQTMPPHNTTNRKYLNLLVIDPITPIAPAKANTNSPTTHQTKNVVSILTLNNGKWRQFHDYVHQVFLFFHNYINILV